MPSRYRRTRPNRAESKHPLTRRHRVRATSISLVAGAALLAGCSSATPAADAPTTTTRPQSAPGTQPVIEGVIEIDVPSAKHVQGEVNYPQTPPVGGDHAPRWQNCGVYSEPISTEAGVHALEHGAVWITYQPTLEPAALYALEALADQSDYILLSPWPDDLPAPVVASAWGAQLQLDSADDPRLVDFLTTYVQSLSAPEPGAPCSGGISAPR